ncbi:collagen alpha-1(I) chain-like [Odocoileus virginianus]|uniref:Collagen alpha-1(I) chain-like n=1 Tax=Odocoileus virginianus TaxID=9874 RepID=A0ABM4J330_ODOVR
MEKSRELDTLLSAKELEDKEQRVVEGEAGAELRASSPGPATSVDGVAPGPALPPGLLATPPAAQVSAGKRAGQTPGAIHGCPLEGAATPPPQLTGTLMSHHSREAQPRRPAPNSEPGGMPDPIKCLLYQEAFPSDFCLGRKDSPSPERPTYVLWSSPSLGHLADGRSPAGPYLLLLDPRALSLGSGETGGRPARLVHMEEQVSKHSDGREEARKSQTDFSGKTHSPPTVTTLRGLWARLPRTLGGQEPWRPRPLHVAPAHGTDKGASRGAATLCSKCQDLSSLPAPAESRPGAGSSSGALLPPGCPRAWMDPSSQQPQGRTLTDRRSLQSPRAAGQLSPQDQGRRGEAGAPGGDSKSPEHGAQGWKLHTCLDTQRPQTPFPSAPDRAHRWEAGKDSVATNRVSRSPAWVEEGPDLPLDGWWAPRSSLDHPEGPPGTTRPGTHVSGMRPGWPAKQEAGQELALGRDQGGSDTRSRCTNCANRGARPPAPDLRRARGRGRPVGRPVGTGQRPPAVHLGPQVPQATTLRPSGSHTEAAAVTSPPFLWGTGARRDKASQLASLGPEPRRQTAPQAEEAPAICRHPLSDPAPPPSRPLPLPQGPADEAQEGGRMLLGAQASCSVPAPRPTPSLGPACSQPRTGPSKHPLRVARRDPRPAPPPLAGRAGGTGLDSQAAPCCNDRADSFDGQMKGRPGPRAGPRMGGSPTMGKAGTNSRASPRLWEVGSPGAEGHRRQPRPAPPEDPAQDRCWGGRPEWVLGSQGHRQQRGSLGAPAVDRGPQEGPGPLRDREGPADWRAPALLDPPRGEAAITGLTRLFSLCPEAHWGPALRPTGEQQ